MAGLAFGYGGINPGATYPAGPLRLGPDTSYTVGNADYRHFSGYNYLDDLIRGFSHTHLVGAGMGGLGNFGVMPVRLSKEEADGDVEGWIDPDPEAREKVWWSPMEKASEVASPGQYGVKLTKPNVDVSLIATSRLSAVHEYTFTPTASSSEAYSPAFILDVCHSAQVTAGLHKEHDCRNASITFSSDLSSFRASVLVSRGIRMFLYGEVSLSSGHPAGLSTCSNQDTEHLIRCSRDTTTTHSSSNGILFTRLHFQQVEASVTSLLQLRVALSFISEDQAYINLLHSPAASAQDRDVWVEGTRAAWCEALAPLSVHSMEGDDDLDVQLYSALYRSVLTPSDYTEEGGVYQGLDQAVHNVTADRLNLYNTDHTSSSGKTMAYYSDFSFWDTFRTQHPWILLVDEPVAVGVLRSIGEMTQQHNGFPKWVMATVDTGSMVGLHGASTCLEAGLSGLGEEFDLQGIQQMLVHQATEAWPVNARKDLEHYLTYGWVSNEADDSSTSLTLSYAYDDFILSGLSTLVGDTLNAEEAMTRSKNYAKHWSSSNKFMCPRNMEDWDGSLECPRSATSPDSWMHFIEGDTLHWSTFVVHDPTGLMAMYASPADFENHLESFFAEHVPYHEKFGSAVPNPYFWMGNEVDSFAVWLFNTEGVDCTRTQYWSRQLTHMHFSNTPHGVPGNEDYGAMASWLLFASLGLYPQAGTTNFYIGSPRVTDANLTVRHLDGSQSTISILTTNNSAENVYVDQLLVNGVEYNSGIIDRSVLTAKGGCVLQFSMSSSPSSGLCRN